MTQTQNDTISMNFIYSLFIQNHESHSSSYAE